MSELSSRVVKMMKHITCIITIDDNGQPLVLDREASQLPYLRF